LIAGLTVAFGIDNIKAGRRRIVSPDAYTERCWPNPLISPDFS
jgi:hypothetical protein